MSKKVSKFTGRFTITGATYDDNRCVIWCCKFYEPFNVIDTSDVKTRQKLWLNCEDYFGKELECEWTQQTKRGTPLGVVYGHLVKENNNELVQHSVRKERTGN